MTRTEAPYLRIVAGLRRRIREGEFAAGDRIPSTREITREWGVAMATASKVIGSLREEGLVRAVTGVGTVVAEPGLPRWAVSHAAVRGLHPPNPPADGELQARFFRAEKLTGGSTGATPGWRGPPP